MPSERVQRQIDALLDRAEEAVTAMDWAQARDASLSVLVADPDNEDAKTFLAMAEPHLGGDVAEEPVAKINVESHKNCCYSVALQFYNHKIL